MLALLGRFLRDRSGTTAIEYALIGTLVSVAIIIGAGALGEQLVAVYQGVVEGFETPVD